MSNTPLKDAFELRKQSINTEIRYSDKDITALEKGDYVAIKTPVRQYFGFVKSIGRVNVVIETPCGGYADNDYTDILDIKFPKSRVSIFCKPKGTVTPVYTIRQVEASGLAYTGITYPSFPTYAAMQRSAIDLDILHSCLRAFHVGNGEWALFYDLKTVKPYAAEALLPKY